MLIRRLFQLSSMLVTVVASAGIASAGSVYTLSIQDDGSGNVVANGSGSFDTAALSVGGTAPTLGGQIFVGNNGATSYGFIILGPDPGNAPNTTIYTLGGSHQVFNNLTPIHDNYVFASSTSGDASGFGDNGTPQIYTPTGYLSGTTLSSTATWDSTSLETLGLIAGTYNYSYGSGDSVTLEIGVSEAPEPGTFALFGGAITLAVLYRRRYAA